MKRTELCLAAEGLFWVGLIALVLCLTALIGCGENTNPIAPEGSRIETVGDLKSNTTGNADGEDIVIVKTIGAEGAPTAPSVVKVVKAGDLRLLISLSHEGEGKNGGEIVAIKATEGDILDGDKIRVYADGDYLGRVRIESSFPISEIHILIEDDDLPFGEVLVEIEISRNGTEVAEAEIEISRAIATGPAFESVEIGDFEDEIVLSFSDVVNAYRPIKDNVDIVIDGTRLPIRTYGEDGTEVVLIMRKDLVPGTYTVSYDGDGGLEGLDGEEVPAFEATLTVEDESAPATPVEPAVWKTIPHGIYGSGAQMLIVLDAFGYKVSPWTRQILGSKRFETEDEPGHTELYRVTPEDLGLIGTYTAADVMLEAIAQGYRLVPEETAAQLRLLYANQLEGELVAVISAPMLLEQSTYVLALGGGSAQYPGKWIIAVNMTAELSAEYTAFILTK